MCYKLTIYWGVSLLKLYLLRTSRSRACSIEIFQEGKIYSTLFLIGLVSFLFNRRFSEISLYILLLYIAYLYHKCPVRCVTVPRHFIYLISRFSPSLSLFVFNLPSFRNLSLVVFSLSIYLLCKVKRLWSEHRK